MRLKNWREAVLRVGCLLILMIGEIALGEADWGGWPSLVTWLTVGTAGSLCLAIGAAIFGGRQALRIVVSPVERVG